MNVLKQVLKRGTVTTSASSALRRYFGTSPAIDFAKQAEFYHKNGYAVLESVIPVEKLNEVQDRVEQMIEEYDFSKEMSVFKTMKDRGSDFLSSGDIIHFFLEEDVFDDKGQLKVPKNHSVNKIGHAQHDLDSVFEKFSYNPVYAQLLQAIGYKRPTCVQSMYIFKSPKVGGKVDPHTDNTFLITNPLSTIGIWVALDDATLENGCMWGVPGSHKNPTKYFMKRKADNSGTYFDGVKDEHDITGAVPLEVPKGSVVVLHGDFVHYSGHNSSSKRRHAYTLHIVESEGAKWLPENWLQRRPERPFRDYYEHTKKLTGENKSGLKGQAAMAK